MAEDLPPDPDELLAQIHLTQRLEGKGRLKIFLGMAPGVGKTYAMLRAAHKLVLDGHPVLAGVVETHGRPETEGLLKDLPALPLKNIDYRGTRLQEFDLDEALRLKPEFILIDELAHTNAPGSRHSKRYQDVLELLDQGIHVLTTLNVQHIESRADIVQGITGVAVRETIPDSLIEIASELEVVDVTPDTLLQRLAEGKVYAGDRADRAARNFFQKGVLTALREMALRMTAERVDHDLQAYMREKRIAGPWKSSDRLLVAVGPSRTSERLIRWTRRAAYNLEAAWIAVTVDTPRRLSEEETKLLNANLALAKELGAEIVTTSDVDVTRAILRVARQRNVTQIVVGKPAEGYVRRLIGEASPVPRLIRESGEIDVYVVSGGRPEKLRVGRIVSESIDSNFQQYMKGLGIVAAAIIVSYLLSPWVSYLGLGLVMLMAIMFQSLITGRGPILLSALVSGLLWNFLFMPPRYTFYITRTEDVLLLLVYLCVAVVTGTLTSRIRSRERAFQLRERRAIALYTFGRELAQAPSIESIAALTVDCVARNFEVDVAIFIRNEDGTLSKTPERASTWIPDEKEFGVALWVFDRREMAGWSTKTLIQAEALHVPVLVPNGRVGVLSLKPAVRRSFTIDQKSLLEALVNQAAISLERELLVAGVSKARVVEESERLHKLLLNSVSHELRTPIAAIHGAATSLLDPAIAQNSETREKLTREVLLANDRLNKLVANILDISRLESGHLRPRAEWIDLSEVISRAAKLVERDFPQRKIQLKLPISLPLFFGDFVLLEQALVNLIHNAAFHTAVGTPIEVEAHVHRDHLWVEVRDRGPGIPPEALPKIFDKFYRVPGAKAGGTGLGLAIAKGFLEVQGGTLTALDRKDTEAGGSGVIFRMSLPLRGSPGIPAERES